MSPDSTLVLDPSSQNASGVLEDLTTDGVPEPLRLDFWRDTVLRRMVPLEGGGGDTSAVATPSTTVNAGLFSGIVASSVPVAGSSGSGGLPSRISRYPPSSFETKTL